MIMGIAIGVVIALLLVAAIFAGRQKYLMRVTSGSAIEGVSVEVEGQVVRAVDPNNPPRSLTYNPRPGSSAEPPRCTCHGIALKPGDKVIDWPIPGHPEGGHDLICQRSIEEAKGE